MSSVRPAVRRSLAARMAIVAALGVSGLGLAGCAGTMDTVTGSTGLFSKAQAAQGRTVQMYVASTRKSNRDAGSGETLKAARFSSTSISIPPGHEPGVIERPTITPESRSRHFTVVGDRRIEPDAFQQDLAAQLSGRIGPSRDVLVFVHGYNVSYDEARFRLAQIVNDGGFTGVPVLFTWPSRSQILAYGSDKESATASRDPLEKMLQDIAATPGVGRVHILAHSMGTWLAMEALRQSAIAGKADLGGRIGEVMLAAPDIDIDVFRAQMQRVGSAARVSVFAAADDRALSVSSKLAGSRTRLGALDLDNKDHVNELAGLNVRVYDLKGAGSSDIFRHGTFAEAPQVVRSIGAQLAEAPRVAEPPDAQQAQSYIDPSVAAARTAAPPAPEKTTPVEAQPLAPL
ncbi:alpha/beta hydrolase [Alsobacter sp. R-9]